LEKFKDIIGLKIGIFLVNRQCQKFYEKIRIKYKTTEGTEESKYKAKIKQRNKLLFSVVRY